MSLISEADYLIHNLRLTYLRHLEDPYGPRIIRSGPRYLNNPHVLAAGLADSERWPELNIESSPDPSDDDEPGKRSVARRMRSGYTGGSTSLKHTQTIMGNRSGALGMRVTGKRSSTKGEAILPMRPSESHLGRVRADSEPTPLPATPSSPPEETSAGSPDTYDETHISVSKRRSAGGSSLSEVAASIVMKPETPVQTPQEPSAPKLHAMPSFSKIADMQARRQRRRAHFSSAGNNAGRPVLTSRQPVNPEVYSSDEGPGMSGSVADDDRFDRFSEHGDGMEGEMEDFDPDFAPARIGADSDMSGADSSVSHLINVTGLSTLEALQPPSSNEMTRIPSIVEEDSGEHQDRRRSRSSRSSTEHSDSTAQMPSAKPDSRQMRDPDLTRQQDALSARRRTRRMTLINNNAPSQESDGLFVRLKTLPSRPTTSALTSKLASSSTSTNAFTETYALISGRAEVASMTIQVFFPHARSPIGKPLELKVRKDATIEEVIGFALWSYWEEDWQPKLDEGLDGVDEARKKAHLSAAGWLLKIAEDDGEVDEDFPAPDRMGKISKFNFDAYAILEANAAQAAQNLQAESKIVRRPSRIIVAKKKSEPAATLAPAPSMNPSTSTLFPTALGSSFGISTSLSLSSSHGPQVLLRIMVEDASDAVHYSTTISVSAIMYMQEVLEHVCRKWKIEDTKAWALLSQDFKILVPLDRTVASLAGSSDLVLVRRASLPQYGFPVDGDKRYGRSTDPNASIFNLKRISDVPGRAKYADTGMQVIAAYKRYTVYRKVPMLVARLVRTLAIDGDYIHIMPSANKAKGVFDSGKTYSYHIKSVHSVQSSKASANFKLVFRRDMGDKRYDFEAESAQAANEIVTTIRGLKQSLDRSSTVSKQRRSRHWKEP